MDSLPKEISPSLYQCSCGSAVRFTEKAIWDARHRSYLKKQWLSDDVEGEKHIAVFQDGQMTAMLCPKSVRRSGHAWLRIAAAIVIAGFSTFILLLSLSQK